MSLPVSFPRLSAAVLTLALAGSSGFDTALAVNARTDDDNPALNARGTVINQILGVLRAGENEAAAGDSCLSKLDDMQKMQEELMNQDPEEQASQGDLLRDVLGSQMEEVTLECGRDAYKWCASLPASRRGIRPEKTGKTLGEACAALPRLSSESAAEEE